MDGIQLTIIGCGDAFNSGGRRHSCFFLRLPERGLLIDCGATSLLGLKQEQLSADAIDWLLLSHFHGDHIASVPFLLLEMARLQRKKPLTIICPDGGREKIAQLVKLLYPGSEDLFQKFPVTWHQFSGKQELSLQEVTIQTFPVIHKKESMPHGFRIEAAGKVIAYSGDTEWTDTLSLLAKDADLFLCECTFYSTKLPGHLNYLLLQQQLKQLTCKLIILTHLDEEMLNHRDNLSLAMACDGMKICI